MAYRRFADIAAGDAFPAEPMAFAVSPAVVDRLLAATGNASGRYAPRGDGPRRAPSMIAAVYLIELLGARNAPPGGIHAKQALRFHRALAVGETLAVQGRVVETYRRKERNYVVSDIEARGEDGALAASGRITSIWGIEP